MSLISKKYSTFILKEFLEYQFDNVSAKEFADKINTLMSEFEQEVIRRNKTPQGVTKLTRLHNL